MSTVRERSSDAFGELLNAVPDAVLVSDCDGRILFCNRQVVTLFGYEEQELLGESIELLVPNRFRQRHVGHRGSYLAAPRIRPMGIGLDLYGLRKDGTEVPVEISLSPTTHLDAPVVIASVRDVSARKQLEDERAQALKHLQAIQRVTDTELASLALDDLLPALLQLVRAVLDTDTAVLLLLDDEGKSLVARAAVGLEEEVAQRVSIPVGSGFAGGIAAARRPVAVDDIDAIKTVNPLLRAKGIRSLLGAPVVAEGRLLGVLHVGTLQHRRFLPEEADLLGLVAHRAALALDRARLYEEAQEAVRIRNEFLSAISHDLGNPVAAIRLESRRLLEAVAEGGDDDLVEGLAQIEAAATRMWRQVEEILDLARLQVGRDLELSWRSTDLVALTRDLIAAQQATTNRHSLRLELEAPGLVGEWDLTRIERVITNLLSNAIKYSPAGGEIIVRLVREVRGVGPGAWAVLQIQDTGIGIPSEDLPHIFERFHRASNVRGHFVGTGIGLAGAQQIVKLHGGEMLVKSEENAGTTVTVRLPLDGPAE